VSRMWADAQRVSRPVPAECGILAEFC